MTYQFSYSISINFTVCEGEFNLITDAIKSNWETEHHAVLGGFWYGNMNAFNFSKVKSECFLTATTRQMDVVILKSLERYSYIRPEAGKLFTKLFNILEVAVDYCGSLNADSSVKEVKDG